MGGDLTSHQVPARPRFGLLGPLQVTDGDGLGRASLLLSAAALLVGAGVLASPWTRHLDEAE